MSSAAKRRIQCALCGVARLRISSWILRYAQNDSWKFDEWALESAATILFKTPPSAYAAPPVMLRLRAMNACSGRDRRSSAFVLHRVLCPRGRNAAAELLAAMAARRREGFAGSRGEDRHGNRARRRRRVRQWIQHRLPPRNGPPAKRFYRAFPPRHVISRLRLFEQVLPLAPGEATVSGLRRFAR